MSSLVIGTDPERIIVQLEPASDFYGVLTRNAGDWVAGATLTLTFGDGSTIAATISGPDATFAQTLPAGGWTPTDGSPVSLVYTEPDGSGTYTEVIGKGEVRLR